MTIARTAKRMTRKLRKHGIRRCVIFERFSGGGYWIYEPQWRPISGHGGYWGIRPVENMGPHKRAAWDRLNAFIGEANETVDGTANGHSG